MSQVKGSARPMRAFSSSAGQAAPRFKLAPAAVVRPVRSLPAAPYAVTTTHGGATSPSSQQAADWKVDVGHLLAQPTPSRRTRRRLSWPCHSSATPATVADSSSSQGHNDGQVPPQDQAQEYVIVNFYHLVDVPEPQRLVEDHRVWLADQGLDLRGRIYYSAQGVNAQYGGTKTDALAYLEWLKSQPLWQGIRHSVWPSPIGHAFPKLRLKYKPNLISLAGGVAKLPVTLPEARAQPLEPAQWKAMLAQTKAVVLDVRNDYEWDAGHFHRAERPNEEIFAETPVGDDQADVPAMLKDVPKDAPIMMYCTGGIRCDIYSTFLKSKGYDKLYTLEGGIQNYLRQEGPELWNGSLYVFDGRMAISGDQRDPAAAAAGTPLQAAVPCQVCGAAAAELPHVNCANMDCNELFIACAACKQRLSGCCCEACMSAPRLLRPAKTEGGHYGAWGNYADGDSVGQLIAMGRPGNRSEGRVARRARHREVLKQKRMTQVEERQARKNMMREAMARVIAAEAQQASSDSEGDEEQPAYQRGRQAARGAAPAATAAAGADLQPTC